MNKIDALDDVQLIFVCGCPHSGTSLLTAMIGAHPRVYSIPEETRVFTKELGDDEVREVLSRHLPAVAEKGADHLCEKTPNHIRHLDKIRDMFPTARIVVIVRDARDVSASLRDRDGSLQHGAERWVRSNTLALDAIEAGWPIHLLKYEDLIEDPQAVLTTLCGYLGLDFDPAMLEYYKDERDWFHAEGRQETNGQRGRAHRNLRNWQVHQPLLDRRGLWRQKLSPEEVRVVEAQCSELMSRFGYELSAD